MVKKFENMSTRFDTRTWRTDKHRTTV